MIKMSEIAELANVSVATVSLALNNKKGVGEETRKSILKIAKEQGYIPPKKNTNERQQLNIQFIVAFNDKVLNKDYRTQPFFSSLIDIIINYTHHESINFSVSSINSNDLVDEINNFTNNDYYDGTIILSTNLSNKSVEGCIENSYKPVVFLDCIHKTAEANIVGINNWHGVHLAINHLIENGHENIGYVQSDIRIKNFEERQNAFEEYIEKYELHFDKQNIITLSPNKINAQDDNAKQIKNITNVPTAFFCENDTLAISFIKSLKKMGYDIPNDISVIGFDNIRESTVISPELTTISVDQEHFVTTAIEQLLFSIENPNKIRHTYINCALSNRESVKNLN